QIFRHFLDIKFRLTAFRRKKLYNKALRQIPMTMEDWETRLNKFIAATDRDILQDAGKVAYLIYKPA
ncbi:MAG: hypothetical protein R6V16_06465, partial [Bacteroidales bacterium]